MLYKIAKITVGPLIKLIYLMKIHGKHNEPKTCAFIAAANHINAIDPILIGAALRRQVHFMAKIELFKNKFLSWLIHTLGSFSVDRDCLFNFNKNRFALP